MARLISIFLSLAGVIAVPFAGQAQATEPVLVFAAASLKNALDAALEEYGDTTGKTLTVSYGATSALAKQIEAGAPAQIFFSADLDWIDYLGERGLIAAESRTTLLGNDLVLVAPAESTASLTIGPGFPIAATLGDGKLAMAATASVPAGKYGMAALQSLGVWDSVSGQVAEAENVRGALQLVARGEAPLGIVYTTDAKAEPGVRVLGTFPADSHPPILYPIALTASATAEARAVLEFIVSGKAKPFFEAQGFRFVAPGS